MAHVPEYDDEDVITLGRESASPVDGPNLGPDERDADLMDDSWAERSPNVHRDWHAVQLGIALLVLLSLLLPGILVFTQ